MASSQKHRGQHANDEKLFAPRTWTVLNDAVDDLSWLWTRGYSEKAALKITGDRYRLTNRQRQALARAACSDQALFQRPTTCVPVEDLAGATLLIDGYNLLITVESGLAGGLVLACRDGNYRDLASVHGTYRRVEETFPAIRTIAEELAFLKVDRTIWYLDKPVSNSGRLKGFLLEIASETHQQWEVELVNSPDRVLREAKQGIVATSDGIVLNEVEHWANVTRFIVDRLPDPQIIPMQGNRFGAGCGL